jgi:hypothetical protein
MGRAYAGTLGLVACGIILARGLFSSAGVEGTLLAASGGLFLFAAIGYLAGQTAQMLVENSVRTQFQAALTAYESKTQTKTTQTKPNA